MVRGDAARRRSPSSRSTIPRCGVIKRTSSATVSGSGGARDGLVHGDPSLGLPQTTKLRTLALLEQTGVAATTLASTAERMASTSVSSPAERLQDAAQVPDPVKQESRFLKEMESIVGLYESEARERVEKLRMTALVLQGLTFLGLQVFLLLWKR